MDPSAKRYLLVSAFAVLYSVAVFSQSDGRLSVPDDKMVGNVYGTVVDRVTNEPIRGAEVFLLDRSTGKASNKSLVRTEKGYVLLPDLYSAIRRGTSNARGEFLLNFAPVDQGAYRFVAIVAD